MSIIKKIEQMRIKRGWSVYKLAELSGLSEKCIYNWYHRNSTPTVQALEGICDAFGITLSQLFADNNLIEVDAEMKELFDDWLLLTQEQKQAVKVMIKTIKG
ncbi:MAG: helix-turn-helix transcriptional regulator [Clostridia bacterium]|nr:helix-turn-helix transcriptional regulator [Clostridia bacterium]MBQ6979761.1 helix-turn-helix transcriptional regulator [Clostridia bacterium]